MAIEKTGISAAKILIPDSEYISGFPCIACDQFTGDKNYWATLEKTVGDKPSALNLIFPEIYLSGGVDERIKRINHNIENYIAGGVFQELPEGFILSVRETPYVKRRIGIIGAVDLDEYEYGKKTSSLIRATEGTIEERIPPRLKIRANAAAEFPHVMVLYDDEKREIAEYYYKNRAKYQKLYDITLNMGGGRVEGYFIPDVKDVLSRFSALLNKSRLVEKYGREDKFVFAVGDGNHSLATAKAHWEKLKTELSEDKIKNHPARYALAEFNNIYDDGIYFEPIFRFISGVNADKFVSGLMDTDCGNAKAYFGKTVALTGKNSLPDGIRATDAYIKDYIAKNGGEVDYIHGEKEIKKMVDNDKNSVAVLFEKLKKEDLFKYVSENGAFPRKTFSMGEGIEKRYYLEGRKIK